MKVLKTQYGMALFCCVVAFSFAVVAGASDIAGVVGKACTNCHSPKRICLNLSVKDGAAWKSTVKRMIGKGAKVPSERAEEAAMYLAGQTKETAPFCK